MSIEPNENETLPVSRRYRWPWFVLAAFVLGVVLAIIWMSAEVRWQQRYRRLDTGQFPRGDTITTNSAR